METKKGICYDYANLFAAFCRTQNITCYVIDGYKRTDPNAKHTWNRLYFNKIRNRAEPRKHRKIPQVFLEYKKIHDVLAPIYDVR